MFNELMNINMAGRDKLNLFCGDSGVLCSFVHWFLGRAGLKSVGMKVCIVVNMYEFNGESMISGLKPGPRACYMQFLDDCCGCVRGVCMAVMKICKMAKYIKVHKFIKTHDLFAGSAIPVAEGSGRG